VRVAPGYNPSHVLTFQLGVPQGRYSATQFTMFKDAVVARLQTTPGVRAAGYAQSLPLIRNSGFIQVRTIPELADQPPPPPPGPPGSTLPPDLPNLRVVSKDFLSVMGVRILAGRGFTEEDRADHPRVMLINQALARSGVLGDRPLGTHLYAFGNAPWEIVGIVEDVRQVDLAQEPDPQVFFDYRQLPDRQPPYYVVRTDAEPTSVVPAIRAAVRQLDPMATIDHIATMEQLLSNSIARRRLYTVLLAIFAGVAAILAAVGLSGVIAYAVTQRTSEIGIRMALGAQRRHVLRLVLGQSARLTACGLVVGVAGAAMLTRYLQAMLFGLTSLDPMTFAAVSLLFAGVATMAAYLPARRAAKLDPLVALRQE
jgi:predicted permease